MPTITKNNNEIEADDVIEKQESIVDLTGIIDHHVTAHRFEDAGGGMMRVIRGKDRNGVFVPETSHIMSAEMVVRDAKEAMEFARRILCGRGKPH